MNIKRAFAITKRILRGLRHDRRTLALIVIAPVLAMCIFGVAFSGEVKNIDVVVVNLDDGPISKAVIDNLDEDTLNVHIMQNEEDAIHKVKDGDDWAAIVFPKDFTQNVLAKAQGVSDTGDTTILVMNDNSNNNISTALMRSVKDAMNAALVQSGKELPVSIKESPVYGEGAEFIDFFVPGIMAFAIFLFTILLTLLAFVGERTSGTLERLNTSPIRESEIVLGYAMAFGIIGLFQASLLFVVATLVFHIMVVGSPLLAYLIIALLAVVSVSLGILLSSLAKREAQAVQFVPLIVLPIFLLSGIFWPVEAIPSILRPLSYLIPPTYAVDAMRSVLLRGWGIGRIWLDIVVLLGFAVVFLTASAKSLKRDQG